MNKLIQSTNLYFRAVKADFILYVCLFVPILMGLLFKFVIPVIEKFLCGYFSKIEVLLPYYPLFDLLLILVIPTMFAFTGAMVLIDESDHGISRYLVVTPLGKIWYLISRLAIIPFLAIIYSIIILTFFSLTSLTFINIYILSSLGSLSSIIAALLIVSVASNKVEALAVAKLSILMFIGLPIAFLVKSNFQYFAAIFPSFWLTKYMMETKFIFCILAIVTSVCWFFVLYKKFEQKIMI